MHEAGFTDITTLECLLRILDVRSISVPVANLGYGLANSDCVVGSNSKVGGDPVTGCIVTGAVHHQKAKRVKHSDDKSEDAVGIDVDRSDEVDAETHIKPEHTDSHKLPPTRESYNFKSALPLPQMTGHTGYLTFATLYPK